MIIILKMRPRHLERKHYRLKFAAQNKITPHHKLLHSTPHIFRLTGRVAIAAALSLMLTVGVDARSRQGGRQAAATRVYDCDTVDEMPQFPGGDQALIGYINSTRRYPGKAYNDRVEGKVLCGFIINTDGSVSEVSVIRGVEETLDREAVRVISGMPRWKAGKVGSEPVPTYYILPVHFRR